MNRSMPVSFKAKDDWVATMVRIQAAAVQRVSRYTSAYWGGADI